MDRVLAALTSFCLILLTSGCQSSSCGMVSEKFIHKYGFVVSKKEWEERGREGQRVSLWDNGIEVNSSYQEGLLHGPSTYTFPYSPQVKKEEIYDQGELLSVRFFDRQGVPVYEETFVIDGIRELSYWDNNGAPIAFEKYQGGLLLEGVYYTPLHEIEGKITKGTGLRTFRDREGILLYQDRMERGFLKQRTTYHPNGKVHQIVHYDNYLPQGRKEEYTFLGNLRMISHWDKGILHGEKMDFREGKKFRRSLYHRGTLEGVEDRFDPEENLIQKTPFHEGKKHGEALALEKNQWKSHWFFQGRSVSKERFLQLEQKEQNTQ